ncbi:uncharacterized protein LOC130744569 [Lotus japonicus]|uniref:uncharacterized protein LOC130744569 n=1 Tax=Lotus japonicus TaxID=34305 RepID=UPI00258F0DAE|nr:uncharacterized protein LOC130744569 [Lotus japonicus]
MSGPWLTWNVRGLGGTTKREAVKKAILHLKPELVLLQETKLNELRECTVISWTKSLNMQHAESSSVGTAGGLMCLWRESSLQVLTVAVETWFILLTVKLPNIDQTVLIGNVYGPHSVSDRSLCLEALKQRVLCHGGLQFVQDSNLLDLPLNNGDYTWFSSRNEGIWSRLDRWLVSDEVLVTFSNISQSVLPWNVSDHRAVGLFFGVPDSGPKPFYYFNHWVDEEGFKELVEAWWTSAVYQGWSGYVLQQKLRGLRGKIREWRRKKGAWGVEKIANLEKRLQEVMSELEAEGDSEALNKERRMVLEFLWRAYREEERIWLQKSRDGGPRPWFSNSKLNKVSEAQKHFLEADFTVEEIWEVVKFFDGNRAPGQLVRGLNSTFIALIPKGGEQEQISDYRPISLIGSIYKLLSKVLSARLLFKIDFAKAYDNVEWDFMLELLQEMGFGEKWISWMQVCVSTASLAVLVNGSPSDFFNIQKGLRQGDPLSPLLFNIVANGMSCMLNQLLEGDAPCGVELAPGFRINHLQFADDSLLFSDCDELQFQSLAMAIEAYLYSSWLKVNFNKSAVYGVNANSSMVQQAATWWNFKIGTLPFIYLGSPLGGNPRRLSFWNPVLENMTAKLGLWSSRFLTLSGRLVLIKSVLNAIPLYYMALYKAPKGIIQRIERIMRRFLWGGPSGENKIMWIAWEDLCKGTRFGGLGVGFLEWKNKAMLLKWVWRFGRERDALWREVVCKKYDLPLQLISFNVDPADVKKLSKPLADVYGVWRDSGFCASKRAFPRVFALAVNKRALVREYGTVLGPQWIWNIAFVRDFLGWERQPYDDLQALLQTLVPKQGERADRDSIIWKHDNMGLYSVKSMCAVVEARWFTEEGWSVPQFLRPILPSKIALFLWQVQKNRITSKENLEQRGVVLENGASCIFCLSTTETVAHLFLHCPQIWMLWTTVLQREGIMWSIPESVSTLLAEWSQLRKNTSRILWEMIPYALCWEIWMARNNVIFHDKLFDVEAIWESHVFLLFTWIRAWWKDCPYDATQFERGFSKIDLTAKVSVRPLIPWKPPQGKILKFNVDGSFQSGRAGIGGILRNSAKEVIGEFSRKVEVKRADEAEVLAILVIKLWEILRRSIRINFVAVLLFCKFLEGLAVCWFFCLLLLFSGVLLLLFAAFCFALFLPGCWCLLAVAECCRCCLFAVAAAPVFCLLFGLLTVAVCCLCVIENFEMLLF